MTREGWSDKHKKMAGNVCRRLKANIVLIDGEYKMDYSNVVPFDVQQECFIQADGFGRLTLSKIEETEYDWSHVRDSSLEAFIRMNAIITAYDESVKTHGEYNIEWRRLATISMNVIRNAGW